MKHRASPPLVPSNGSAIICSQADFDISRIDRRDILLASDVSLQFTLRGLLNTIPG